MSKESTLELNVFEPTTVNMLWVRMCFLRFMLGKVFAWSVAVAN